MSETYYSLTPSVLEKEEYYEALNWAINNKETTNIAVTGDYGSGKSSVVHSFVTNKENDTPKFKFFKKNPEFKSLKISLATFSSGKSSSQNVDNTEESQESTETNKLNKARVDSADSELSKDEILELEQAILKHMFYQLDANELPHSRFNQINPISTFKKTFKSILITFFCSLIFLYFQPEALGIEVENGTSKGFLAMLAFVGVSGLVYQVILMASSSQLKKFGVIRGEVEFTDKTSDSIFHQYLEEIIYFFEGTKYDLVIFEDLDRFQRSPELFTAIREINLLLNKRKKINNTLNFIYVVRDDLFSNVKRTKFFDYILPIVPIISASNAHDIFESLLKESKLLDNSDEFKDLIKDITYGLTDLRLIKNIINEYKIYSKKLNAVNDNDGKFELLPHKLLAVIIYKNLMPKDFTELRNHQGILARIFYDKQKYIQKLRSELTTKIEAIETDIANSDNENLESVNELAQLVISKLPRGWSEISEKNDRDRINLNSLSTEALEYYSELQNYYIWDKYQNSTSNTTKGCSLKQHMNEINYEQRKALIENKSDTQRALLINKKNTLIKERNELTKALLLEDIYQSSNELVLVDESIKHSELINYLLQNGYIAEDYANYLSYFYGEGVYDQKFIQSVLYNKPKDFDYQFDSFDNVINSLNGKKFNSPGVLNSNLLQGLLDKEHPKLDDFLVGLIKGLKTKSEAHINFFKEKIIYESLLTKLTPKLLQLDPQLPYFLLTSAEFNNCYKDILLQTLKQIDVNYFQDTKMKNEYKSALESDMNLLIDLDVEYEGLGDHIADKKIKAIFDVLEIRYPNPADSEIPQPMQQFLIENGYFKLNYDVLKWAYKISGGDDFTYFEKENYKAITDPQLHINSIEKKLNDNESLNYYFKDIYPLLENLDEDPQTIVSLLNSSALKLESKEIIINKQVRLFENIEEVDAKFWDLILTKKLIKPHWHNIHKLLYREDTEDLDTEINLFFNDSLLSYLNAVSDELQPLPKDLFNTEYEDDFFYFCAYSKQLNLKVLRIVFADHPLLTDFDITKIPEKNIKFFIEKEYFQGERESYKYLKNNFQDKEYAKALLTASNVDLLNMAINFQLNINDIEYIIDECKLETHTIIELINKMPHSSERLFELLFDKHLKHQMKWELDEYQIEKLLSLFVKKANLISLLILTIDNISESLIKRFISKVAGEYKELLIAGRRPVLSNTPQNKMLLGRLVQESVLVSSFKEIDDNQIQVFNFRG